MVNFVPPPAGVADRLVYDYLYQLSEYLTVTLSSGGWAKGNAEATSYGTHAQTPAGEAYSNEYRELKALVVKNAKTIEKRTEEITAELTGSYVAISDFGSYVEEINNQIEAHPEAITQYYSFYSELADNASALREALDTLGTDWEMGKVTLSGEISDQAEELRQLSEAQKTFRGEMEGYIRTGIVDYEVQGGVEVPILGMAVGQNLETEISADGKTVVKKKGFRALYTAKELSFWQDGSKVAYVNDNMLYITQVVALSKVRIGRWDINDDDGLAFKWIGT